MVNARSCGYTYLVVLFIVALMGVGSKAVAELWHTAQMRDKEQELLYAGAQYRRAIELYHANSPGTLKQYPRELSQLLQDPRRQEIRRYLRRLYRDPMTPGGEWGIVKAPDGGIAGVYSLSDAKPFKTADFKPEDGEFTDAVRYSDWKFVAAGAIPPPALVPPQIER
jgi:hypothetical protein